MDGWMDDVMTDDWRRGKRSAVRKHFQALADQSKGLVINGDAPGLVDAEELGDALSLLMAVLHLRMLRHKRTQQ